jgi:hypothetical protein
MILNLQFRKNTIIGCTRNKSQPSDRLGTSRASSPADTRAARRGLSGLHDLLFAGSGLSVSPTERTLFKPSEASPQIDVVYTAYQIAEGLARSSMHNPTTVKRQLGLPSCFQVPSRDIATTAHAACLDHASALRRLRRSRKLPRRHQIGTF